MTGRPEDRDIEDTPSETWSAELRAQLVAAAARLQDRECDRRPRRIQGRQR